MKLTMSFFPDGVHQGGQPQPTSDTTYGVAFKKDMSPKLSFPPMSESFWPSGNIGSIT